MKIEEYIASGILEAYLAGELTEQEMREVDSMAEKHHQVKDELDELRIVINKYAEANDLDPSQEVLKEALVDIKEGDKQKFISILKEDEPEVVIKRVNIIPVWSIAASIMLVISLGFNYIFYHQFKNTKDQLAALRSESLELATRVSNTEQNLQYAELRVAHFLNEDNIHVRMDGLAIAPESFANVFWNKKTNAVFISVDNLPEPPHGHQYQLWAIKSGEAPIDAGIFDHTQLIQELKVIKGNVQAFAVTLEEEGGSPIATVDQTFVKGVLQKS